MTESETAHEVPELPLALPAAPAETARPAFPWLASVAPVLGALVLWNLTGSPLALVFAALGPVVAVASLVDGRRQAAAQRRRATRARVAALDALRADIERRHAAERRLAWRRTPSTADCARGPAGAAWNAADPGPVVIGRGDAPSALRIGGAPADEADRRVLRLAGVVEGMPVLADAAGGIGFVGPLPLARAAGRAALVQLAGRAMPGRISVVAPATPAWVWCSALPHRQGDRAILVMEHSEGGHGPRLEPHTSATALIAVAERSGELPPGIQTVVRLEHPGRAVLERERGRPASRELEPELLSTAVAADCARSADEAAARAGLAASAQIPQQLDFDRLDQLATRRADRSSLAVVVGVGGDGPIELDLATDGPHALVAGTSGSGKSEFLLTWLAALASVHPPELVAFLLVDFKGGAAFEPLRGLPHVAGLVTDLDEAEAVRAVSSLRAELRRREEALRASEARDIAELTDDVVLPRLVIVVDEFQAMVERFPDLAPLIADIAARGRSLGVHLVLAAQRPNGVVRENVTANCGLRLSLRVLHRADSLAVLGVDRAAELDPACPGRVVLARDGAPIEFQSALVSPSALDRLRARASGRPARRPWLDPLPVHLDPADPALASEGEADLDAGVDPAHATGPCAARNPAHNAAARNPAHNAPHNAAHNAAQNIGLVIGLADEPERQRRSAARWHPGADGPLLVLGAPGSGRTTALGAIAAAFSARHGCDALGVVGGGASREWDTIHDELERVRLGRDAPRLIVVDDLDRRFRAWPESHRPAVLEALEELVGEGRASGLLVAASALSARSIPAGLREEFGSTLLLRHVSRAEFVQAGGPGEHWRADDPPGAAWWRGHRVQLVAAGPPPAVTPRPMPALDLGAGPVAVVSRTPAIDADLLLARSGRPVVLLCPGDAGSVRSAADALTGATGSSPVLVADADTWLAHSSLLTALRQRGELVVHAGPAEFRAVTRDREPPPMLDPGAQQCWLVRAGSRTARRAWPPVFVAPSGRNERNPQFGGGIGAETERDVPRN